MEIRTVPITSLNPAVYNPRKDLRPEDPAYRSLARSLDRFGCVEPIVWNQRTGNVVGGHQRLKVLTAAGATELAVSVVDLPEAEEKALNLALNKVSGEWDGEALDQLLRELAEAPGIDETLSGFSKEEIDRLLAGFPPEAPLAAEDYVDSFFEPNSEERPRKTPEASAKPEPVSTAPEPLASVTVYGLSPERLEALTGYLEANGFLHHL